MKKLIVSIALFFSTVVVGQQNKINFEHIALLLPDAEKATEWYCSNLDMKIVNKGTGSIFVTDKAKNIMFEFLINHGVKPLNFKEINALSMHIAFHVRDAEKLKKKLVESGASIESELTTTDSGDKIMILRDPWGVPLQFVERKNPMLRFEGIYAEHIAFNVNDAVGAGKWFADKLTMSVVKEGGAPDYGRFVADTEKNMMLELYQKSEVPVLNLNDILPAQFHIAFSTDKIEMLKEKLTDCEVAQDLFTTDSGDKIIVLRNKEGFPLQFVKRKKPML
jgi:catechol 2,3-dioxygenase-like lactoylglutathione lyase family enzyme